MAAVTVFAAGDEIRMAEIPLHDAFLYVLPRKREAETTTGSLTEVNTPRAVNLYRRFEAVLLVLRVLISGADAFLPKFLDQSVGDDFLPLVEFFDADQPSLRK